MFRMLMPMFSPTSSSPPVLAFFLGTVSDTVDASTFTFSSVAIGDADTNRKIFASVGVASAGGGALTITSVTIGGVTAKLAMEATGSTDRRASIYVADVPSGTTANVVVVCSVTASECVVSLYRSTIPSLLLIDRDQAHVGSGSVATLTLANLAVVNGGFFLATLVDAATGVTTTYNGTDTIVEDDERAGVRNYVSASCLTTEDNDTRDITFTTVGNSSFDIAGVSFAGAVGFTPYTPVLADTFSDGTDSAGPFSFAGKSIGTADALRQLVIAFGWESGSQRAPSTVTVDGNAATLVHLRNNGSQGGCAIYRLPWPTGTTGTVAITMNGTVTRMAGGIYDTRPFRQVEVDSASNTLTAAGAITAADVEIRDKGFIIEVGCSNSSSEDNTVSYNGTDTITRDAQITIETARIALASGLTTEFSAFTNDIGFSSTGSTTKRVAAASWI